MRRTVLAVALFCALVAAGTSAQASKVKVWYHRTAGAFEKAQFKDAVVSSEGVLQLGRQLRPLADIDAAHVWDVVEDRTGNLFVATGDEGKVYKVTADGKVTVAWSGEESQVLCLVVGADGAVYAGTGPSGLIVRIAPEGGSKILYRSPENYVWSLATDGHGLYAGTGPRGRIYRVGLDGQASVHAATKQDHVLSLAPGPDGILYAGTDRNGLVYRIDAAGKMTVVFQAPQAEVRSLLLTADGLYAGTSSPKGRHGSASAAVNDRAAGGSEEAEKGSASHDKDEKKEDKPSTASAPSAPGTGENSVYRITADGGVRELFREKALVLSELRLKGRLFVGTGTEGRLFEIDESTREHVEIARLDHGEVHCLLRRRDGTVVLGAGDPGRLYELRDRHAAHGAIVSEVLDARLPSHWGVPRWHAETPPGTSASMAVRTGNVAEPDDTWSDWTPEQTDADEAQCPIAEGRYLQYRVTMATDDPNVTPAVSRVAVRYTSANLAPEVASVDVPDVDGAAAETSKKLKLKWSATDPNEDELTYTLFLRKEGWKDWVVLEENLTKCEYEWDATTAPSGIYRIKVAASDRTDNPRETALTGERVSVPFAVAHEAPTVQVKVTRVTAGQATCAATAADALVRLTAAAYALDGKKWVNVFPENGLFDSKTARFALKTEALKPGTHVLVFRVRDAAGNTGTADVVFEVDGKKEAW